MNRSRPAGSAAPFGGGFGGDAGVVGLLPARPDTARVEAIQVGAMSAGVEDVVGQAGEPLERVHGLEIPTEGGIHLGAVHDGFLDVEVESVKIPSKSTQKPRTTSESRGRFTDR